MVEMWDCEWKQILREDHEINSFVRTVFPFNGPLKFNNLLSHFCSGDLFGYV